MIMQCGGCSKDIEVSEEQYRTLNVVACVTENCDGGVDLVHARRHADDF
jgi:hypothetical protein